jgi:flagellar protein FlaI
MHTQSREKKKRPSATVTQTVSLRRGGKPVYEDKELLRRKAAELDTRFIRKVSVPEKVFLQAEMAHMRRAFKRDKKNVSLTYPVNPPYAFVHISFDPDKGDFLYEIREPTLHEEEEHQLAEVKHRLESVMNQEEIPVVDLQDLWKAEGIHTFLRRRFSEVVDLYEIDVPDRRRPVLLYYLQRELIGMGRADAILRDSTVEDISCNGPKIPVFVFHRVFGSMRTNVQYASDIELNKYIFKLAQTSGKHVSVYQPILDATLRDGSRINLTLGTEVTKHGSTFSIRKFSDEPISPIDLLRFGSMSAQELAFFWHLIQHKRSILISGGTASGKTTLLNALLMFVRQEDKIVSIEDTAEIQIHHSNWIQSVARAGYGASGIGGVSGIASGISSSAAKPGAVSLFDLLVAALRQRPEYVVVGEVRGTEAFTLFQAISVGHAAMATVHAGSIDELIHRIESEPMNIPRVLFQALDIVVFPAQVLQGNNRVRRIRGITEILEVDSATGNLLTNEVFAWDPKADTFPFLGRSFALEGIGRSVGQSMYEIEEELKRKERFIHLLDEKTVSYYKDVSRAINAYHVDPETTMANLEDGKGI